MTGTLTVPFGPGAKVFEFRLRLPPGWQAQVTMQQASENEIAFVYAGSAGQAPLFTLFALPEAEWQARQGGPEPGNAILTEEGVVFAYRAAAENPFAGAEAERFAQLLAEVARAAGSFELRPIEQGSGTG